MVVYRWEGEAPTVFTWFVGTLTIPITCHNIKLIILRTFLDENIHSRSGNSNLMVENKVSSPLSNILIVCFNATSRSCKFSLRLLGIAHIIANLPNKVKHISYAGHARCGLWLHSSRSNPAQPMSYLASRALQWRENRLISPNLTPNEREIAI